MLEPSSGRPGHWQNPHWQPGSAGSFAVVIGVSRYRHLSGGPEPVSDNGQRWIHEAQTSLGQLGVSALTAARFFEWLRGTYAYRAAPVAQCWLLLAPAEGERDVLAGETDALSHSREPTMAACEAAIREWCDELAKLPRSSQEASRALFFFSGHGLEVVTENQLLLPSDYLGGPAPHWDAAISTHNLRHGLDHLAVPHRYYFVDACRNDFPEIRLMQPKGAAILPQYPAAQVYRGVRAAAVLYATTSSLAAWQPRDPTEGPSLFGRALLDGLAGRPDIELQPVNGLFTVNFGKLEGFVSERVLELLRERDATVEQTVQPSGIVRDEVVSELSRDEIIRLRPALAAPAVRHPGGEVTVPGARTATERSADVERTIRERFDVGRLVPQGIATRGWAEDFDVAQDLFGHATATDVFSNLRLAALAGREWIDRDRFHLMSVDRAERADQTGEMIRYRMRVVVDNFDLRGHWLQLADGRDNSYGVVLPSMGHDTSGFILHVDLGNTRERRIHRLEAVLADDDDDPRLAAAARLWALYRTADVGRAVSDFEFSELEQLLRQKVDSPLAATVAGLVLLRADRRDLLHDWLRNLANWFEQLPDGPVLWAEQVLRDSGGSAQGVKEAGEYLGMLDDRGLPLTAETFGYALSLASRLESERDGWSAKANSRFERVHQRLTSALRFYRPGGLFTSYAHFDPKTGPAGLRTPPAAPDAPAGDPRTGLGTEVDVEHVDIGGIEITRRPT
jgi:hypothetical protein